jgi:Tfp pilus assembly protein PilV
MAPADYLKFGSMGFAALILTGTLVLYQRELHRPALNKGRMQSMLYFMGFALLLLLVSAGLEAVKRQQVATLESAQAKYAADLDLQKEAHATEITKLNAEIEAGVQIKETALYEVLGALQQIKHGKLQAVVKGVKNPTRSNLIDLLAQYCLQVQKIRRTSGESPNPTGESPTACEDIRKQK